MTRRTRALPMVAALLTVPLAACGSDDQPGEAAAEAASPATVTIKAFAFDPDPLTVAAGTTVTFENGDSINHSVTAGTREEPATEEFDGLLDGKGTTFELTLDEPGTYAYFCRFHPGPGMTAEIVVE